MKMKGLFVAMVGASLVACGGDGNADFPTNRCSDVDSPHCIEIAGGDAQALLDATNALEPGTTIILGKGTYTVLSGVTIRTSGVHLVGQGIDETTLDFGEATAQTAAGVDVVGDDFLIQDLTILDTLKDGVRVEDSDGVVFRRIRATWTNAADQNNGSYGIYPVKSQNVLVEDCFAENASDAGLYVGQSRHVIVRNNTVTGNVAGLEIENTQFADVYGNTAEGNTGGIVVFDLPGNPIVGRDVRLRDNIIRANNLKNFSPGGTVQMIPAGTGTFAMASRRVEITGNTYENNKTVDIAIISGLVVEADTAKWEHPTADLVGDWEDLGLMEGSAAGTIVNYRTEEVLVANNTHSGSGKGPDITRDLGAALFTLFAGSSVDSVLYDTIGESAFDAEDASANSNDNHICAGENTNGTFASLNLGPRLMTDPPDLSAPVLRLATAPFAPFDCTALTGGPVGEVVLPGSAE